MVLVEGWGSVCTGTMSPPVNLVCTGTQEGHKALNEYQSSAGLCLDAVSHSTPLCFSQ